MHPKPRKVLVTGGAGLLGSAVVDVFRRDTLIDVQAVDLPDLDITDAEQVAGRCAALGPDLVINCAAYTAVDACEENEETARLVNGTGPGIVARAAAGTNARLIHISTDYVFDGTATVPYPEDHPTGPPEVLSAYGRSKLLGEERVLEEHPGALIVRTAWLYGRGGVGFPNAILRRAREVGELRVVNDQTGSPTLADDLADALYRLALLDIGGLLHVTNSGRCTWYEFAGEILRRAAVDVPITPVTTAEFPRPARRPAFSVLDNSRYVSAVGRPMRSWPEALAGYMGERTLQDRP